MHHCRAHTHIVHPACVGGFKGDLKVLLRCLLPGESSRVYNMKDKQIIKHCSEVCSRGCTWTLELFSPSHPHPHTLTHSLAQLFGTSADEMLEHLEQGDVSETVRVFFERSTRLKPLQKSSLSILDVDQWLEGLTRCKQYCIR